MKYKGFKPVLVKGASWHFNEDTLLAQEAAGEDSHLVKGDPKMHTITDNQCLVCGEELECHGTTMPGSGEINSHGNLAGHADGPDQALCHECGAMYQEDELISHEPWAEPDLVEMKENYKTWKANAKTLQSDI